MNKIIDERIKIFESCFNENAEILKKSNMFLTNISHSVINNISSIEVTLSNMKNRELKIRYNLRDNLISSIFYNKEKSECFDLMTFLEDFNIKSHQMLSKRTKKLKFDVFLADYIKTLQFLIDTDLGGIWTENEWYQISDKLLDKILKERYF